MVRVYHTIGSFASREVVGYDSFMRLIIALFLLLTFWEPIYALIRQPPNTTYTWVHNHPEDYYYFLHLMRQGYDGALAVTTKMTPEVFPPQFVAPFFPLLGMVGRVVPLGMGELYTLARLIGSVALMLVIAKLIQHIFVDPRQRIGALVITLAGTFLPTVKDGVLDIPVLVGKTWTELDPVMRLSFVPHHLASKILFVAILLLMVRKQVRWWNIAVLTVLMGFISPVILVTFAGTLGLWMICEKFPRKTFLHVSLAAVATGAVSLYHWQVSKSVFPWTTYGPPWENNWLYLTTATEYLQSFGVLFPIAIVGVLVGFRKSPVIRMLTAWVLAGWILIFVVRPLLPFSNSRYLAGYQWIAVNMLAAYGLVWVGKKLRVKHALLTLLVVLVSVPSWYLSIQQRIAYVEKNIHNPNVFLNREISEALSYVQTLGSGCTVVAPDWFSTMIPAYSSCRSVSGHRLMTWANDIKVYEMNEFFFQPKPLSEKAGRIKQYGITHVITLDNITGTDILPLLAPTPVFTSGGVRVYEVLKN